MLSELLVQPVEGHRPREGWVVELAVGVGAALPFEHMEGRLLGCRGEVLRLFQGRGSLSGAQHPKGGHGKVPQPIVGNAEERDGVKGFRDRGPAEPDAQVQ